MTTGTGTITYTYPPHEFITEPSGLLTYMPQSGIEIKRSLKPGMVYLSFFTNGNAQNFELTDTQARHLATLLQFPPGAA